MIWGAYIRDRYFCCVAVDAGLAQLALWRQLRACAWAVPLEEIRPFAANPPVIVGRAVQTRAPKRRAAA